MNKAALLAKYNDATSGLFKTGQSRGIGSDDMRELVQDIHDSILFGDDAALLRDQGSFDASGTPTTGTILYPAPGTGSGTGGAIRRLDAWTISVADGAFFAPVGSLLIALIDTPGQTDSNWRVI